MASVRLLRSTLPSRQIITLKQKRFESFDEREEVEMKLTYEGLKDKAAWEQADIQLPSYDVEAVAARTKSLIKASSSSSM